MPEVTITTPVEVTRGDYEESTTLRETKYPCTSCILALAMNRALGFEVAVKTHLWTPLNNYEELPLPEPAIRLVREFDFNTLDPATLPVTIPFEIPERLLKKDAK